MGAEVGEKRASYAGALRLAIDPSVSNGGVLRKEEHLHLEMGILEHLVLGPHRPLVMEYSRWPRGLTDNGSLLATHFCPSPWQN